MNKHHLDFETLVSSQQTRSLAADIVQFCTDNNRDLPTDPLVAFKYWLEWQGIVHWDQSVRTVLWDLITSDAHYLTTTENDREEWLKSLLRPGERVD